MSWVQACCVMVQLLCVVILLCVISAHLARACSLLSKILDAVRQQQMPIRIILPERSHEGFLSKAMSLFSPDRGRAADARKD